jgi:uncharacterized membrane protein HdeD (DUF308 family)
MTLPDDASPRRPHDLGHAIAHLRRRWPWIVAFGVLTLAFGLYALTTLTAATVASVYMIAIFMIIVGGTEIVLGIETHVWSNRLALVAVGLLYVVAGSFALANPLPGAAGLTLMLGAALLATGLARIYLGSKLPQGPSILVVLAGGVTTLLGMMVLLGWPENSVFVLGMFLGVDLLFYGASWIAFGLALGRR